MAEQELAEFINIMNRRLIEASPHTSPKERILLRTVKLAEEYGELCNEILSSMGEQRKAKLTGYDKNNLPNEFADVIITTLLVAKSMNIDMVEALDNKMGMLKARYEQV